MKLKNLSLTLEDLSLKVKDFPLLVSVRYLSWKVPIGEIGASLVAYREER